MSPAAVEPALVEAKNVASALPEARPLFSDAVATEARRGLCSTPKTLSPWLFYDRPGSELFERITAVPEYYLTRAERALLAQHADEILRLASVEEAVTLVELGAGTASKTGLLLAAAVRRQSTVLYQPVDVSASALEQAAASIHSSLAGVTVRSHVTNYVTNSLTLERLPATRTLAIYIGSSIGNFSPAEARGILSNLRRQLVPGDTLLLGTDLAPNASKSVDILEAAYDDAAGVTSAFNRNVLVRLNRELGANFNLDAFSHLACWNPAASCMEMHLVSQGPQQVTLPADASGPAVNLHFDANETIHTENSYKFTEDSILDLLESAGFSTAQSWQDPEAWYALTLAVVL